MVANTPGATHVKVREAAEKIENSKFCYACQKPRALSNMRMIGKGKWRCVDCLLKQRSIK